MRVRVQLHAGWSVNHVVPILFPDKPIVAAMLTDEEQGNDALTVVVDGKSYTPDDVVPEAIASHYIRVMGDVLLGSYDRSEPENCELVARWYRESELPKSARRRHESHA